MNFNQPRILRKYIKTCLKKYEDLTEDECAKLFCILLKDVWNWEQEIFKCNLGVSAFNVSLCFSLQKSNLK